MKLLKRCKVKRGKKDMEAIAQVIHNGNFKGSCDIPCDVQHLLWLLRHHKRRYMDLVLNHPSVLSEDKNLGLFRALYMRLQEIWNQDPAKYSRIISQIPYCKVDQDNWKFRCQHNKCLMKVLQDKNPLTAQPPLPLQVNSIDPNYSNDGDGLLEFLSDSYWNIIDYSVGEVKKGPKRGEKMILFEYHQVQHMFSAAFPQVICRFQKAMLAENELPPHMFNASLRDL